MFQTIEINQKENRCLEVNYKPLSVNAAWKGKRYKTDNYQAYETLLLAILPKYYEIPEKGDLAVIYSWGFSSKASDYDNPIKPLQDILSKKYGFDDKRIRQGHQFAFSVKKGEEYFEFWIGQKTDPDYYRILLEKISGENHSL